MTQERLFNFNAGPATLPVEVLQASARALVDFQGKGVGIAEISHRSKEFDAVLDEAIGRCRDLMGVPAEYDILFLQGGATQLFTTIPMNFLRGSADYIVNGEWTKKAAEAAAPYGVVNVIGTSEGTQFDRLPKGWQTTADASYLYVCTNETIYGTRWSVLPEHPCLIADVSSEFMARPLDVRGCGLIYGGAQKNLGPAGVVLTIVRKQLYERIPASVPAIFNFQKHAAAKSCLNTPPTLGIYMLLETFRWLERQGGLSAMEERNETKARIIYDVLDEMPSYYPGTVTDLANRSRMNITFRLPNEQLTKKFVKEAEGKGMIGLAGYRTVGGVRASVYNAMPVEGCEALASHMREFAEANGQGLRPQTPKDGGRS